MKPAVRKPNPTAIGAFVLGAAVLLVGGIAYFGKGSFLSKTKTFVLFFDSSLQGLNVGAPVFFRGVKVGMVKNIVVRYHPEDMKLDIPVYVELEQDRIERVGDDTTSDPTMRLFIKRGMRAQLTMQSFVTGLLAVELDFFPDSEIKLHGAERRFEEIPTRPSAIEELTRTIQNLPIQELVEDLHSAVKGVNELVRLPEIKEAIASIGQAARSIDMLACDVDAQIEPVTQSLLATAESARATLKTLEERIASAEHGLQDTLTSIQSLVRNADGRIAPLSEELSQTAHVVRDALEQARKTLAGAERSLATDSALYYNLVTALEEVALASRSIRALADYLERYPESLLQGKAGDGDK